MATATLQSDFKATLNRILNWEIQLDKLQRKMSFEYSCGRSDIGEQIEAQVHEMMYRMWREVESFELLWKTGFDNLRYGA